MDYPPIHGFHRYIHLSIESMDGLGGKKNHGSRHVSHAWTHLYFGGGPDQKIFHNHMDSRLMTFFAKKFITMKTMFWMIIHPWIL